jgi:dethiobiotin synthetase
VNGFFITGTDTDAGKTALSALLLAGLHQRGQHVLPMKPAQTGCDHNIPDLDYALALSGIEADARLRHKMAPACYQPACSPHLAAEMENRPLTLDALVAAYHALCSETDTVLVEGAGGVLVPLNRQETMLDLISALQLPILIAARPGLGTINHTLLTIQALQARQLEVRGFIFVHTTSDGSDFTEPDNAKTIAAFSQVPWLGTIPYTPALAQVTPPCFNALPDEIQTTTQQLIDKIIP